MCWLPVLPPLRNAAQHAAQLWRAHVQLLVLLAVPAAHSFLSQSARLAATCICAAAAALSDWARVDSQCCCPGDSVQPGAETGARECSND